MLLKGELLLVKLTLLFKEERFSYDQLSRFATNDNLHLWTDLFDWPVLTGKCCSIELPVVNNLCMCMTHKMSFLL